MLLKIPKYNKLIIAARRVRLLIFYFHSEICVNAPRKCCVLELDTTQTVHMNPHMHARVHLCPKITCVLAALAHTLTYGAAHLN